MTADAGPGLHLERSTKSPRRRAELRNTCSTAGTRSAGRRRSPSPGRSSGRRQAARSRITRRHATNPAHRTITVHGHRQDLRGRGQTTLLDTRSGAAVDVAARRDRQSSWPSRTATTARRPDQYNDVATATYTDKVTGIAVPGDTTATASATCSRPAERRELDGDDHRHRVDHRHRPTSRLLPRRRRPSLAATSPAWRRPVPSSWQTTATDSGLGHLQQDRDGRPSRASPAAPCPTPPRSSVTRPRRTGQRHRERRHHDRRRWSS